MTFGQPLWFWAFALLPLLLFVFFGNEAQRARLLQKLVAARLQDRLAGTVSVGKRRLRFLLQLLGMSGVIISLAQPRLGYSWQESKRKGRDVIIAIDVSKSMLATDLAPNRLERAKLAAQDLISQLEGDRVGLIAFAGSAFLQAPLTADFSAVLGSLQELDTDIIERGGTNIAEAIKVAVDAFGKGESDHRGLVLFTDGEELDADGIDAAKKQEGSIRIFTTGLGSPDGSLIPLGGGTGGGFVKDSSGQIVKSRLDEDRLRKIAEATGGFYVHLQSGPAEMKQIVQQGLGKMTDKDIDAKMSRQPIERYQWPLGAGLLCLAASMLIGERRRRRLRAPVAVAAGLALFTGSAQAVVNPGVDHYDKQDFQGAYDQFSHQLARQPASPELNFNLGTAAYQLKKDDEALLAFSKATLTEDPQLRVKAEMNLGHTLFRTGGKKMPKKEAVIKDWKNSLGHYDQALKVDPANKEVQGYREFVRRKIEELEKEQKQDQQKKDQDKKDDQKKDDQKKDDQKDQQKKDQKNDQSKDQKQDQKKDDSQSKDQQGKDGQKDQPQKDQGDKGQQGDKGDQKDQGDKGEPKPDSKDGQSPDQKPGDPKDGSKGDDKKDGQQQPGDQQNGDQNQPPKDGKDGQQPQLAPPPEAGDKKPTGDLKSQQASTDKPENPQEEAAAEEQAAAEGRMTEREAASLLDSMKNEDARVRLIDPNERQGKGRVLRDW